VARVIAAALLAWTAGDRARGADGPGKAELRVGISEGDIRGDDQRALQAAVDQVASLGGADLLPVSWTIAFENSDRIGP
jgi:hypothetical protein